MKRMPSPATAIASLALFVAVGGPAEAAKLINGSKIKRGTITSKQVKDRGLAVRDLSTSARRSLTRTPARSVGTAQLREGSVGAAQIRPGSVTAAALTADAISSANIIDKQVGNADLADSAVTAAKLATGSVRKSEIAGGAVGTSELAGGAVTGDKLAPDAVTGATVVDGSLGPADFADAHGLTPSLGFGQIGTGQCADSTVTTAPGLRPGADLTDDVVLATPVQESSAPLVVTARATSPTAITFTACNPGASRTVTGLTFRVLAIDA